MADKMFSFKGYRVVNDAQSLEDVLCLSTLMAGKILLNSASLEESKHYYNTLLDGCNDCKLSQVCLACIINE